MINYDTFSGDTNDTYYLAVPFEMIKHGWKVDMTPRNLGDDGGLYFDEEYIMFWWYNEKLYYNIEKHNEDNLE